MGRGAALLLISLAVLVAGPVAAADAHTLSRGKAKRAVQRKANAFAHKKTRITTLMRLSRHRYYAQAKWTRTIPDGCKGCGFDPVTFEFHDTPTTESCFAELYARFKSRRSGRVLVRLDSYACF